MTVAAASLQIWPSLAAFASPLLATEEETRAVEGCWVAGCVATGGGAPPAGGWGVAF